jgi:hypothetical protein
VHLHSRELAQDFRRFFELDPVELDVRARRKVAVTAVVLARDRASTRIWSLRRLPYGMAMRCMYAWRCMYRPFCRRSGRNSSSLNSPDKRRRTWSAYCATRSSTMVWSY